MMFWWLWLGLWVVVFGVAFVEGGGEEMRMWCGKRGRSIRCR